jgi:hypothetical protein
MALGGRAVAWSDKTSRVPRARADLLLASKNRRGGSRQGAGSKGGPETLRLKTRPAPYDDGDDRCYRVKPGLPRGHGRSHALHHFGPVSPGGPAEPTLFVRPLAGTAARAYRDAPNLARAARATAARSKWRPPLCQAPPSRGRVPNHVPRAPGRCTRQQATRAFVACEAPRPLRPSPGGDAQGPDPVRRGRGRGNSLPPPKTGMAAPRRPAALPPAIPSRGRSLPTPKRSASE